MTISFVNIGATSATADTATPFAATSYPLPAGVAADDLLIVGIGDKPFGTTPTPPASFALRQSVNNGSVSAVADGGSVVASAYTRTMVAGDVAPSFTWAAQYNPQIGVMIGLRKTNAGAWSLTSTSATDSNTATTAFSGVGGVTLGYTVGDWAVVVVMVPTDAGTLTGPALAVPGCTVANLTVRGTLATTAGFDGCLYIYTADITAGTASGVPTFTATGTSGATGSAQGSVIIVRVAEPVVSSGATVTPATVLGSASIPTPIPSTPTVAAVFRLRKTGGGSRLRAGDQLRLGASTVMWATAMPATVAGTASIGGGSIWGPPPNIVATPITSDAIRLTWTAVAGAVGYDVERDGVVIALESAGTTYTDMGLAASTLYSYRIQAVR